jgi:hypothetical protein
MNTEEVVEMIDAITEGKVYATSFEGRSLSGKHDGQMTIAVGNSGFGFKIGRELFDVTDPRTAREIAGALVAWANRKDGEFNAIHQDAQHAIEGSLGLYVANGVKKSGVGEADETNPTAPSPSDWKAIKNGYDSREEWYRRNVSRMTQETKNRNLKDLDAMLGDSTNPAESRDIRKAMKILIANGAKLLCLSFGSTAPRTVSLLQAPHTISSKWSPKSQTTMTMKQQASSLAHC